MWINQLTTQERRTMSACFMGWTLDALDVQIYSFVIPTLLALWKISPSEAGMLGTVTLLTSALGGWLAGLLSDRYGRVRILQVAILWYSIFTFLCGFAQTFEQLFVFRALEGLGFGGEWATGAVLIGEVIRNEYRGRAVGFVQTGWAVGWGLAALLFGIAFTVMPPESAWRWLFWIGLAPALLVLWVRRHIDESAVFIRNRTNRTESLGQQLVAIFHPDYLWTTIKVSALATGAIGGSYTFLIWLPTYLKTVRGLSVIGTTSYTVVMIVGAFFGLLLGAHLADRIGRKGTFLVSAIGSAVMLGIYMLIPISDSAMLVLGLPLGFCAFMMFAPMGPYMTELYPTRMRGTGQGFCYNFGRGIGALFPGLVGFLSKSLGLGEAIALFGISAYGLMIIAIAFLPETAGRALVDDGPVTDGDSPDAMPGVYEPLAAGAGVRPIA